MRTYHLFIVMLFVFATFCTDKSSSKENAEDGDGVDSSGADSSSDSDGDVDDERVGESDSDADISEDISGNSESESDDEESDSNDGEQSDNASSDDGKRTFDGAEVFPQDELLEFHFTMAEADYEHLEEQGIDEVYVPAALHVKGSEVDASYDKVGIRHKGAWTLTHCWEGGMGGMGGRTRTYEDDCAKLSYKIKFNEYEPEDNSDSEDQDWRLYGLKKVNLHAMATDESKVREALAYDLFRSFGVKTSRTGFAKMFVNDTYVGLFTTVEAIDGRFTAMHFPHDKDGNLYKEAWPSVQMADARQEGFLREHLRTNDDPEDNPDMSGFQEFAQLIDGTSEDDFQQVMADVLNVEGFYRYMAVDRAIRNWDGITAFYDGTNMQNHNYYWYHEAAADGIWHLIPWDTNDTLWYYDPYMHPEDHDQSLGQPSTEPNSGDPLPDWNEKPASCRAVTTAWGDAITPSGCDTLINQMAATGWDQFQDIGEAFLAGPLQVSVMREKMDAWVALIHDAVQDDPTIDYEEWQADVALMRDMILPDVVADFEAHLTEGYIEH